MSNSSTFTKSLAAAVSNGICTSQSGSAGTPLTLNGSLVTSGVAILDATSAPNNVGALGCRVAIAYTGTDTSFTITGTNATGNNITDVAVGSSGAAQSNLDFVTVTSITPVGGGLTGVIAGTNGVGSSPWWMTSCFSYPPMNTSYLVELVSGSVNFSIQHTYDDPNNLTNGLAYPIPIIASGNLNLTVTSDGVFILPIKAVNVLINSGTGVLRCRFLQSGVG